MVGVPKYIVPNNRKTALIKNTKDELNLNTESQDLEEFYNIVILPPPARKPKRKANGREPRKVSGNSSYRVIQREYLYFS